MIKISTVARVSVGFIFHFIFLHPLPPQIKLISLRPARQDPASYPSAGSERDRACLCQELSSRRQGSCWLIPSNPDRQVCARCPAGAQGMFLQHKGGINSRGEFWASPLLWGDADYETEMPAAVLCGNSFPRSRESPHKGSPVR